MANQLLLNRGFENELEGYVTQGSVSTNHDIAYSGTKSAKLISTPTSIAEISQMIFFISPSSPVKFSFLARRFISEDVQNISNIRAEVNFISLLGTVIPPSIVITIRGRDISKNTWNYYEGYAEAPPFSLAAQVVIRLEPPASESSGLLVDDLALVAEVVTPPVQQGIPAFPSPFVQPPAPAPPVQQGIPAFPGSPFTNLPSPGSAFNMMPEVPCVPKEEEQRSCKSESMDHSSIPVKTNKNKIPKVN